MGHNAGKSEARDGKGRIQRQGETRSRPQPSFCSSGRSDRITWVRDGKVGTRLTRAQINESVDKSLRRLGTDHLDLLQAGRSHLASFRPSFALSRPYLDPRQVTGGEREKDARLSALQLHWPDRYVPLFGAAPYGEPPAAAAASCPPLFQR